MKTRIWADLDDKARADILRRPESRASEDLRERVRGIVEAIRDSRWEAACAVAQRIDGAPIERIPVAPAAEQARRELARDDIMAIEIAVETITDFHRAARADPVDVETRPGLRVRKLWRPIERVGLYIPGGTAPLFSTLLMLAIPAREAGVAEIAVATPPRADGGIDSVVALAADLSGIDGIWAIGGAQAIGALAFGAGEIPRVDKIAGPGNAWVAEAKRLVASMPGGPAIDLPAGPSELFVIADTSAEPARIAADLLSQAEHDTGAQVLLATPDGTLAAAVADEIASQMETLPRRATAEAALEAAIIVVTPDLATAADIANTYAPEHLSLAVADAEALLPEIRHAGAVFAGHAAAESFGDYLAGSSHVLPTDGAARAWGGVTTQSFMKAMTVQSVSDDAAAALAAPAAALARLEGLEAHARAAEIRAAKVPA